MTLEELQKEREELISEINSLKEKLNSNDQSSSIDSLRKENESLKNMIDQYKNDLIETKDIVQKLFLEKGEHVEPAKNKSSEEVDDDFEAANKALDDYIKSKIENEKGD